jgi:hypothetical protein
MQNFNALLWSSHIPESWFQYCIGSNCKGLGFQLNNARIWVTYSQTRDYNVRMEYRHRITRAWRTFFRTHCFKDELPKIYQSALYLLKHHYQDLAHQETPHDPGTET